MRQFIFIILAMVSCTVAVAQSAFAESKGNFCFLNHEKIQPTTYPQIQTQQTVFADFNQDGLQDVAYVANNENKLFIQLNSGNAIPVFLNTVTPVHNNLNYNTGNAVAADFNNDGKPDLATINYFGNVFTFKNNGSLIFDRDSITSLVSGSGFFGKLYPIQLDNDNRTDLLSVSITASPVPGFHFSVLKNNSINGGALSFDVANSGYIKSAFTFSNMAFDAQAGDLNNDGLDEFMFVSDLTGDSVTVMYSLFGALNQKISFGFGGAGVVNKKLLVTDVNSNGSRDVAVMGTVATNLNYVYVYAPVVTASVITSMNTQTIVPFLYYSRDFTFSDLNNDGLKELVVINGITNALQIYPQLQPLNFVSTPVTFTLNNHYPEGIRVTDADNNFRRDLVTYSTGSVSSIAMLRNFTFRDSLYAIPNKTVLCNGESIILKHELKGYQGAFSSSYSNFQPSLNHTLQISAPGNYSALSNYSFIASGYSCSVSSNTLSIQSGITPTLNVSGIFKVCKGDTALLAVTGADTYSWSNGSQMSTISISPSGFTNLSVTGTNSTGCFSTVSATLDAYPVPTVAIHYEKNILCENESAIITASGAQTYSWAGGQQTASLMITQNLSTPQSYTVTGIDINGCFSKASFETVVNTNCTETIKVTNGITPNNDGNNDFFFIRNIEKYPNNKVSVFNRWGALLYSASGYDNHDKRWPKQNTKETEGTYFYVVETGNGEPPLKGWLEIIGN